MSRLPDQIEAYLAAVKAARAGKSAVDALGPEADPVHKLMTFRTAQAQYLGDLQDGATT